MTTGSLGLGRADRLDTTSLAALFTETFAGYHVPTHVDAASLEFMIRAFDVEVGRSVIGYEGDQAVALGLLSLRGERAWVAGMGVVPAARGRGYGSLITRALAERARDAGARYLDLEVLVQNEPAARIYALEGFEHVRHLNVWMRDPLDTAPGSASVEPVGLAEALDLAATWRVEPDPWQRERRTIERAAVPFEAHGVRDAGDWSAVVVHRDSGGTRSLLSLAARPPARPEALEALLRHALAGTPGPAARLLNLPDTDPAAPALERLGLAPKLRQSEMRLRW